MKISELSRRAKVPIPTIKFYIREGLLSPGARTGPNQADYGPGHLARLTLIRSLREDAGLPVDTIARSLRAADEAKSGFVVAAIDALDNPTGAPVDTSSAAYERAEKTVLSLAHERGWNVKRSDVSVQSAARALVTIEGSFPYDGGASLAPYLEMAERIAACEIPEDWAPEASRDAALRYAVLGTVLFEPFILALRRMAHVARSRELEKPNRRSGRGKRRQKT